MRRWKGDTAYETDGDAVSYTHLCASAVAEETITLDFWVRTSDDFSSEIAAFEAANPEMCIRDSSSFALDL